jgi:hypothetical protein
MNGHRGQGAGWLVFILFLIVIAALAVLGAVIRTERDAVEQTVTYGRTPTADVFEPPQGNTDDGDGAPGTPPALHPGTWGPRSPHRTSMSADPRSTSNGSEGLWGRGKACTERSDRRR